MIDIAALITKLRNAPRKVGTFGRGDTKPLDEFAPLMTGEERDWLAEKLELSLALACDACGKLFLEGEDVVLLPRVGNYHRTCYCEVERLKRTSGEG
jgi:hypothetical protein